MEKFEIVPKEEWNRKEHFDFFSGDNGSPLYDITAYLDVTHFYQYTKQNHLSFYYSLIWATTEVMNQITAFRYKIRGQDIILYPRLIPAFADLKKEDELFHIVVLDLQGSMAEFAREAKRISEQQKSYFPAALADYEEDVLIQFSCLPWLSFTNLGFERSHSSDDSVPKVTWGKYEQVGEKMRLPYAIQVNHRLIDGVHLGELFSRLQDLINNLS